MFNLIMVGPPGAGKGTQAKLIAQHYGWVHLSTGDLFRQHLKNQTELGKLAQQYMNKGLLVPDSVVIDMVKEFINQHKDAKGIIFDGFPRTIEQAKALDDILKELNQQVNLVIFIDVPEDEIVKRIQKRALEEGRTDDADEAIIRKRLEEYMTKTAPLLGYYERQDKLVKINGVGTIEEIFNKIKEVLDKHSALA
ncbi:MAG: adenylate kinase [Chlorobi bacterium]|nr:adenylate kinase [Chlorobiota bacterium]